MAIGEFQSTRQLIRMYPDYAYAYKKTLWCTGFIALTFPFSYSYATYMLYEHSEYFRDMVNFMYWEIIILTFALLGAILVFCTFKCLIACGLIKSNTGYNNYNAQLNGGIDGLQPLDDLYNPLIDNFNNNQIGVGNRMLNDSLPYYDDPYTLPQDLRPYDELRLQIEMQGKLIADIERNIEMKDYSNDSIRHLPS